MNYFRNSEKHKKITVPHEATLLFKKNHSMLKISKLELQINVDGLKHVLRTENLVELFLGEQVVLED